MPANPMGNVVGFFSYRTQYFYFFNNYKWKYDSFLFLHISKLYSIDLKLMLNLHNFFFASVKDIKSQVNLHNFYLPSESVNKFTY